SRRQNIRYCLEAQQHSIEALEQRIVQFSCDSGTFIHASLKRNMELPLYLLEAEELNDPQQSQERGYADAAKPESLIPSWQDLNAESRAGLAPGTAAGGSLHFKCISPYRKSRIPGDTFIAPHFMPHIVEPLQLVTVTIRLRVKKTQ